MKTLTVEQLKQIVELANGVPQDYKAKCFELLLNHALSTIQLPDAPILPKTPKIDTPPKQHAQFIVPIDIKALLSQYSLDETKLWKLFFVDGGDLRAIYKIDTVKKSKAQIQFALLMSLQNALHSGQFQVDVESLRAKCIEQKCYDSTNFMNNLKNNKKLFKTVDKDQPLVLSPDGKSELADIIEELSA